jgi:hypothetical protein
MPRYVVTVELERTYERSLTRRDVDAYEDEFASLHACEDFPSSPHDDWIEVDGGANRIGDLGDVVRHRSRRASILRTVRISRPVVLHARNPKDARVIAVDVCAPWRPDMPSRSRGDCWYLKDQIVHVRSVHADAGAIRTRPRFDVDFEKVIAPDAQGCGLDVDQAFELFRWMVAASANYERKENWYTHHAHMSMNEQGGTNPDIGAVVSRKDLAKRIVRGVLSQGHDLYREWRADHGVTPTARMSIEAPTYGRRANEARSHPSGMWKDRDPYSMMEQAKGLTLSVQLNPYHDGARVIQHLGVVVTPDAFVVDLMYGYDNEPCASYWHHELARSRGREPFVDVFDRAVGALLKLAPDWDEQIRERRMPRARSTPEAESAA